MGHGKTRASFRGTPQKNVKRKSSNVPTNVQNSNVPTNVEVKGPSMTESVKSGFGFGVGSAVAHSAVSGIVSVVSGSSGGSNEIQRENQKLENCAGILKKYVDCLQLNNYSDIQPECVEIKKMMETMECNK